MSKLLLPWLSGRQFFLPFLIYILLFLLLLHVPTPSGSQLPDAFPLLALRLRRCVSEASFIHLFYEMFYCQVFSNTQDGWMGWFLISGLRLGPCFPSLACCSMIRSCVVMSRLAGAFLKSGHHEKQIRLRLKSTAFNFMSMWEDLTGFTFQLSMYLHTKVTKPTFWRKIIFSIVTLVPL